MSSLYPLVEAAVVAACLGVILFAVANVATRRGTWPAMAWAAVGLGWFLIVWELARAGVFEGTRGSGRLGEMAVMLVPLAAGLRLPGLGQSASPSPADLVTVQVIRVVAVVVLLAWASEALPAWLALPIGGGDILVGLAGPSVGRLLRAGQSRVAVARLWNAIGAALALFTMAAPVTSAPSTGYFFSLYPLVLLPTFLAPVWLVLHLAIQRGLAVAAPEAPRG